MENGNNFFFFCLLSAAILGYGSDLNQASENHSVEKNIAEYIKKEFDKKHGPTWHCIVGRNFGNSRFTIFVLKYM